MAHLSSSEPKSGILVVITANQSLLWNNYCNYWMLLHFFKRLLMAFKCGLVAPCPAVSTFNRLHTSCPTGGMWHMVTNWFGGRGSLSWSCGMTCVLQMPVDPSQEVGLGSVVVMVAVDLDHNEVSWILFERTRVQSYLRICKDAFIHLGGVRCSCWSVYSFSFKVSNELTLM